MSDLHISEAAEAAAYAAAHKWDPEVDQTMRGVRAAAPHIVAAELRRLARDIGNRSYTATPQWVRVQQELGARADELDGGQS